MCNLFLASLGKNPIITIDNDVIQVLREKIRLLHLLWALWSGLNKIYLGKHFQQFRGCSYCNRAWKAEKDIPLALQQLYTQQSKLYWGKPTSLDCPSTLPKGSATGKRAEPRSKYGKGEGDTVVSLQLSWSKLQASALNLIKKDTLREILYNSVSWTFLFKFFKFKQAQSWMRNTVNISCC